ncbi:hypothetical protein F5Y14DRAFT_460184 [Nemania sp. NC0429]|nr:hypothetical protein F5Y14DRAFT_460184 [Nemania sp. NC0429]
MSRRSYFPGVPSADDLRKRLQEEYKEMKEENEEFEQVCRTSPLTWGQTIADPGILSLVDSMHRDLKEENEQVKRYRANLEANQEALSKLAENKAAIEKAVLNIKSDKAGVPKANIPKELCELALEVNQILFGDLDNLRDIDPDVRKALYNRELEHYRGNAGAGSSSQGAAPGSQAVDLSRTGRQLISQLAETEVSKLKLELKTVSQELAQTRTLMDQQRGLIDSMQGHADHKLSEALAEIKELRQKVRDSEDKLRGVQAFTSKEVTTLHQELDKESLKKNVDDLEKEKTAAVDRANDMKTIFRQYLVETVGDIPAECLRAFVSGIVCRNSEPVDPAQYSLRPFVIHSPQEGEQDVGWLRDIRPSSSERLMQLYSRIWSSRSVDTYDPMVFELLRLLIEDFREKPEPGMVLALPYLARAIHESVGPKGWSDVWLVVAAYRQIHYMCRVVFGEQDVDDLGMIDQQILGGDDPQGGQIILAAVDAAMRSVRAGMSLDSVRAGLRQALGQQVIYIGPKCLATTMGWSYVMVIDLEEKKVWRLHKSLAEEKDQSNWPISIDLRFKSAVAEWPAITLKDVDCFAEICGDKQYNLNEGQVSSSNAAQPGSSGAARPRESGAERLRKSNAAQPRKSNAAQPRKSNAAQASSSSRRQVKSKDEDDEDEDDEDEDDEDEDDDEDVEEHSTYSVSSDSDSPPPRQANKDVISVPSDSTDDSSEYDKSVKTKLTMSYSSNVTRPESSVAKQGVAEPNSQGKGPKASDPKVNESKGEATLMDRKGKEIADDSSAKESDGEFVTVNKVSKHQTKHGVERTRISETITRNPET